MIGWIFAFYASYVLSFLPIPGVMNLIVSRYYTTYIAVTPPYLLSYNPYTTFFSSVTGVNFLFLGNILWWSPLIIWIATTFTQKYHLYPFNWKLLFYNFLGIFLFYEGLASGLYIGDLASNAPF